MDDQELLLIIERIAGDDFFADLEFRMAAKPSKESDDMHIVAEKVSLIYRLAHSAVKKHSCYHVHEDWRKLAEREATHAD